MNCMLDKSSIKYPLLTIAYMLPLIFWERSYRQPGWPLQWLYPVISIIALGLLVSGTIVLTYIGIQKFGKKMPVSFRIRMAAKVTFGLVAIFVSAVTIDSFTNYLHKKYSRIIVIQLIEVKNREKRYPESLWSLPVFSRMNLKTFVKLGFGDFSYYYDKKIDHFDLCYGWRPMGPKECFSSQSGEWESGS